MFWERFYDLCASKNMKPNTFAKEVNISSGVVSKWKQTQKVPEIGELIKISKYFDVSLDYLVFGYERTEVSEKQKKECIQDSEEKNAYLDLSLNEREFQCLTAFNMLKEDDQILTIGFMKGIYEKYTPEQKENVS